MTSTALPLDRESMRLIAEIGFIGTQTGQLGASRAIFDSLRVLRPDMIFADVPDRGHVPFLDEPLAVAAMAAWLETMR